MKTRCKFKIESVTRHYWDAETVKASAVCSDKDPENVSFAAATPTGTLEFTVSNPEVIGKIQPGSFYYLDLIPVESK